jgi:hypothetical protein
VTAVPGTAAGVDILGTAGETITAGSAVYLSDGAGGKTAGLWYNASATNPYSSTLNAVGLAPNAIATAASGSVRLSGAVPTIGPFTLGALYYVGTAAGTLTTTPPANRRLVGQADTTSSLVVLADPPPPTIAISTILACGRLTLTTAVPITTADVTAATTLYYTPVSGCNQITLWNGTANQTDTLTETSIAVPATTATMYDVFAFDNAGVVNIEALAWTNDTTRATALTLQNGYLAKAATPARRYIGSFRTTAVSGQTEDSAAKRYVWNYYHRADRSLELFEATASWTYNVNTIRQARATATNQVEVVIGVSEDPVVLDVTATVTQVTATNNAAIGIGLDSTTTFAANQSVQVASMPAGVNAVLRAQYRGWPGIGRHVLSWNEVAFTTVTTTFWGTSGAVAGIALAATTKSGLLGVIKG